MSVEVQCLVNTLPLLAVVSTEDLAQWGTAAGRTGKYWQTLLSCTAWPFLQPWSWGLSMSCRVWACLCLVLLTCHSSLWFNIFSSVTDRYVFLSRRMFVPWWKASGLQWGTGLAVASCLCLQPILGMWWESPGKNTGTGTRRRKFAGSLSIWRLSCATGIWLSQGRVCTVLKAWTKWASLAHLRALCWLALIRMGSDTQSSSFLRTKETWPFVLSGSQPGHLTAAEKSFQW